MANIFYSSHPKFVFSSFSGFSGYSVIRDFVTFHKKVSKHIFDPCCYLVAETRSYSILIKLAHISPPFCGDIENDACLWLQMLQKSFIDISYESCFDFCKHNGSNAVYCKITFFHWEELQITRRTLTDFFFSFFRLR